MLQHSNSQKKHHFRFASQKAAKDKFEKKNRLVLSKFAFSAILTHKAQAQTQQEWACKRWRRRAKNWRWKAHQKYTHVWVSMASVDDDDGGDDDEDNESSI